MRQLWILSLSLVLLAAAPVDPSAIDRHYNDGQKLFGEGDFAGALREFEAVDELVPNEPRVYSWIGACLNELGRHAEAKKRLQDAFDLLRGIAPDSPIDLGYYTLLAGIQANLGEYEAAVKTIQSYSFSDDGSEEATKRKQAFETAKQTLAAKLVAVGDECLRSGDLACSRTTFTQADVLLAATPSVREAFARDLLARADKAPVATDEDKAKQAELRELAVAASRLWLEDAGPRTTEAQRLLSKALLETKTREGYTEAIEILSALRSASPDPAPPPDSSIDLDLAMAHGGLEEWDSMVEAASAYIQNEPDDKLGQGHCLRSFAQYQLGRCQETIDDGERCKNPDGTPRSLKHVDACKQRFARMEASKAAAREASEKAMIDRKCGALYTKVKWARGPVQGIALADLVPILEEFVDNEGVCRSYLDAAAKRDTGNAYSSPLPALCADGAATTSSPANLAMMSKGDLEALRGQARQFLTLCRPSLDASQVRGVEEGLLKIAAVLERHQQ
jgi:tetratricopeptide (TPR) repeat protein